MRAEKMNMPARIALIAVAAVLFGCSTPPKCGAQCGEAVTSATPAKAQNPLKVAVYADAGPGGIGAVEWFRLVNESPEMELYLVDGKMVRAGALKGLDVIVMPGGSSKTEFDTLGTNGVERLKDFLRNGGGYIGTCAGCCLLMDGPEKRARIMPWNTAGAVGATLFPTFDVNAKGAAALGIKEGQHVMRYHGGPCLWPTTNVIADAKMEIWGTYHAEANMKGRVEQKKKMFGAGALVGGTYGKGRVFVTSAHPEYFNSTLYVVKGAFKYVTGRDVTFPARKRNFGAINVGFVSGGISGVDTAQTAIDIDAAPDLDLVPIDIDAIRQRRVEHLDVVILTNGNLGNNKKYAREYATIREFAAKGGKVLGFKEGSKILPPGGIKCGTGQDAVKAIRSLFPAK